MFMRNLYVKIIFFIVILSVIAGFVSVVFAQETATTTPTSATSTPAVVMPKVYPGTQIPLILPRSTWDNSPDLNALLTWMPKNDRFPSDWQPVERIVIHHSDTPTSDSVPAIQRIQSIYRFHSVTRGWGDIGYNYIIDQQGNIYEGRYGGNGSRGAHVFRDSDYNNFNFGTIGIVMIGTYSSQDMSEQMYDSVSRLVGWLAAQNGLSPTTVQISAIWDQRTNNFTGSFTGYAVLGHKDIESTACPGIINSQKIRQQAEVFKNSFQNHIYQAAGLSNVYSIVKGVRQVFNSLVDYTNQGKTYNQIAQINKTQIDLFSENRFYKFPDNSLVKSAAGPKVYLVENGKIRPMEMSAAQFNKLGFNFSDVKIISQDELDVYASGLAIKYAPDGQLVKKTNDSNVYYGENGRKRLVGSASLFNFLGFVWSKIKSLASLEIDSYLTAEPMAYPDGSLVKSSQSAIVYLINGKHLHQILSAGIFESLGLKWKNVKSIPAADISSIPIGAPAKHGEGTLLKAAGSPNIYVIKNGQAQTINSAAEFVAAGYKWANVLALNADDFSALYPSSSVADNSSGSDNSNAVNNSGVPSVRVMIYEVPVNQNALISASGSNQQCDANNNCQNKTGQSSVAYSTSAYAKFIPGDSSSILQIDSYNDWNWNKTANYNKFRGNIEIKYSPKSQKLFVVNELPLEDYLKGIGEVSNSDEYGHIQTLIVAARTYAYNYAKLGGKYGADEVYYLKNTAADQLYKGYGREGLAPNVVKAVDETRGEIATYNGEPIVAAYSSGADEVRTSGTRSACSVWGGKYCQTGYEYLSGGVKDPDNAPYTRATCGSDNHCVGLSAAGSRKLASQGKSYKEILTYYYKGTTINKIY